MLLAPFDLLTVLTALPKPAKTATLLVELKRFELSQNKGVKRVSLQSLLFGLAKSVLYFADVLIEFGFRKKFRKYFHEKEEADCFCEWQFLLESLVAARRLRKLSLTIDSFIPWRPYTELVEKRNCSVVLELSETKLASQATLGNLRLFGRTEVRLILPLLEVEPMKSIADNPNPTPLFWKSLFALEHPMTNVVEVELKH